jgi:undecaprenyl-diphosphatase
MSLFHAFVLGLIQGVTEFLPISSSGFLILIPNVFGWELQPIAFDAIIHLATLCAVAIALFPEIKFILKSKRHIAWWIVFATLPALVAGFLMEEMFQISFRSTQIVAWSLIVWGIVLFLANRYASVQKDELTSIGWKRAFCIGLAQMIALIPGTSRSGITITAGLFGRLSRSTATTFSFLLSLPIIAIAGALHLITVIREPELVAFSPLAVGFVTAFVTALLTIKLLRRYLAGGTYAGLAIFRIIVGILLLV